MCCAADGSANGAAPAVPQLSYSEMKDGGAALAPCSGLFILEDETPTKRLALTSVTPAAHGHTFRLPFLGLQGLDCRSEAELSVKVSLPLLAGGKEDPFTERTQPKHSRLFLLLSVIESLLRSGWAGPASGQLLS